MASLFTSLKETLASSGYEEKSKKAREWFREEIRSLSINRKSVLNDEELKKVKTPKRGFMYMYVYDPKMKKVLPYYDRFPLTILVQPDENKTGFYGLNLHYLNPITRAVFLDKLFETMSSTNEPEENTRLRIRYQLISTVKKYREFRPCFKHYLFDHIRTQLSLVPATNWEVAMFLPTEHFKGKRKEGVWLESLKIYRKA